MNNLEKEPKKEAGKNSYLEGVTRVKWKEEAPEKRKKWSKGKKIGAVVIVLVIIVSLVAVIEGLEAIGVSNAIIQKYEDLKKLGLETSKEALDKFTKATGIKFSNSKEKTTSTASFETQFTGLEIQGLNHVWQNSRWEYVDPNDNLVAGYWDDKEGKFELTGSILRGEWTGLFVPKMTADIEKILAEKNTDEDWTVEKWESGETKIPIPFMITKGGVIEQAEVGGRGIFSKYSSIALAVSGLPNTETIICYPYAPDPEGGGMGYGGTPPLYPPPSIGFSKGEVQISFNFTHSEAVPFFGELSTSDVDKIKVGTPFLKLNGDVISSPWLNLLNPSLNNRCQLLLVAYKPDGYLLDIKFDNLLTDEKGRFIFIIPTQGGEFPSPGWKG